MVSDWADHFDHPRFLRGSGAASNGDLRHSLANVTRLARIVEPSRKVFRRPFIPSFWFRTQSFEIFILHFHSEIKTFHLKICFIPLLIKSAIDTLDGPRTGAAQLKATTDKKVDPFLMRAIVLYSKLKQPSFLGPLVCDCPRTEQPSECCLSERMSKRKKIC